MKALLSLHWYRSSAIPILLSAILFITGAALYAFPVCAETTETYILDQNYGQVPLSFVINEGQFDPAICFVAEGNACNVFNFTDGKAITVYHYDLIPSASASKETSVASDNYYSIHLYFYKANMDAEVIGEEPYPWNSNYFIGNDPGGWYTDIPQYGRVRVKDIYDGIDLVYIGDGRRIRYELVIQPGADPSQIVFYHKGDEYNTFMVTENGDLYFHVSSGEASGTTVKPAPRCYQVIDGREVPVALRYNRVSNLNTLVTFEFGDYDPGHALIIQPDMVYSSMFGLKYTNGVSVLDTDDEGNAYVAGNAMFESLYGYLSKRVYMKCLFMMKLNERGDELRYVTYFGVKEGVQYVKDMKIDKSKNSIIAGYFGGDFPLTPGAFDKIYKGAECYIIKINANGNGIIYSTYMGGDDQDIIESLAIDKNDNVYVTGNTISKNFPITSGSYDETFNFNENVFVSKISAEGENLVYSTFLDLRYCKAIAVDDAENAYVTGNNLGDIYLIKLNTTGSNIVYLKNYGGNDTDEVTTMKLDNYGFIYIGGKTASEDFPETSGFYNDEHVRKVDSFIMKINSASGELLYSILLGGNDDNTIYDLGFDKNGKIYVTGSTESSDFPLTNNALIKKKHSRGSTDIFLTILENNGTKLSYSSYIGYGFGYDIEITDSNNLILSGNVIPSEFPYIGGIFDTGYFSDYSGRGFLIKLDKTVLTHVSESFIKNSLFELYQPFPNPFNSVVGISFNLNLPSYVKLSIYTITGQKVTVLFSGYHNSGHYSVIWNAEKVSSGVYFIIMNVNNSLQTRKILLMK